MSIFTKRARPAKWCSAKPRHSIELHGSRWTMLKHISIQNLKRICYGVQELWVFSLADPNFQLLLIIKASSTKKDCYAWQSIDNVDMYRYTKFYQNIPCGSRVISVFANWRRTNRQTDRQTETDQRTHTVILWQTCGLCNMLFYLINKGNSKYCMSVFQFWKRTYFRPMFHSSIHFISFHCFLLWHKYKTYEPRRQKTGLRGFRPGPHKPGCTATEDGLET